MRFHRTPGFATVMAIALSITLLACGDKEPEQRQAFITFLQTRVIDRPGIRIPRLTPEEESAFGPYKDHFAVIADFNRGMNDEVAKPVRDILDKGMPHTIEGLLERREDLKILREAMARLAAALTTHTAKADAARKALSQPEDLAKVYDAAYAKTVTELAAAFSGSFYTAVDKSFATIERLADLLHANRDRIEISGFMVTTSDAGLQQKVAAALDEFNTSQTELNEAQSGFRKLAYGR